MNETTPQQASKTGARQSQAAEGQTVPTEARTAARTPATDPKQQSTPVSQRPPKGRSRSHSDGHDHAHGHSHDHMHDHSHGEPVARTTADGVPRPALNRDDFAHIPGWGADLDREQRPAVPMERMPARLDSVPQQEQQALTVEVLHSNERPGLTTVYGTTVPPKGLSGSMRRLAFKYSENDVRHWLTLLAADRVNVVEGVISDLAHGRVPNVYAEMGGRAELKHNPAGAARKALVVAAVVGVGYALWRHSRSTSRRRRY